MGDFNETDQTLHLNQKNRRGKKHTLCIQNREDILDFMNTPTCYGNGGCENFGVFRVKNRDFTPKNHIFSNCGGRRENF
jgi:hypothetical protein